METFTQETLQRAARRFAEERPDLFSCSPSAPISFSAQLPNLPPEPAQALLSRLFPEGVYLHGPIGAGKAQFLRQLFRTFEEVDGPVPLYVDLRDFTPELVQSSGTPQMAVFSLLAQRYFQQQDVPTCHRISRILDFRTPSPRFLLWLDGLHRTPSAAYPDMLDALATLNTYPNLWVVATGRSPDPAVPMELTIPRGKRRAFPLPNLVALLPRTDSARKQAASERCTHLADGISAAISTQDPAPLRTLEHWSPKLGPRWCALCAQKLDCSAPQVLSKLYDLISSLPTAQAAPLRLLPRRILESFPHTTPLSQPWVHLGARLGDEALQWALAHRTWLDGQPNLALDRDCQVHICRELAGYGDSAIQFQLARAYDLGETIPPSPEQAILWYTAGAEQDHPWCAYHLGRLYEASGDRAQAVHWLRIAARQRLSQAAFLLARLLLRGNLEERQEALEWHRDLERQSDLDSLVQLGCLYWLGDGVEQDAAWGTAIFRAAVARRSHGPSPALSSAQLFLSYAYHTGFGVQMDSVQARYWQEKAQTGYYSAAQTELGLYLYRSGQYTDALRLFRRAWLSGLAQTEPSGPSPESRQHTRLFLGDPAQERRTQALLALSDLYQRGLGVPSDPKEAAYYASLAQSSNEQEVPLCFT